MMDPTFDPLQMLQDLHITQANITTNQQKMAHLLQSLTKKVNEQQLVIDMLIESIMTQNHTNEQILKDLLTSFNKSIQGQQEQQ